MPRSFLLQPLLAAALAVGGLVAAGSASAHGMQDAAVSITVGAPVRHAGPAPVQVQPAPVYVTPVPRPVQPRYVQVPDRGLHQRGRWGDADRDGIPNRYDRRDDRRYAMRGPWGDADRDGVPNRDDRAPFDPRFR